MSDFSKLSKLVEGVQRHIALDQNTLIVGSLKVGSSSPAELTKAILENLISLQNGTDFSNGTNSHTHDGRYYTETEIGSTSGTTGASLVGVGGTPTNYSPASPNVQAHLEAIDSALASSGTVDFSDSDFRIHDNADSTRKLAFEVSAIAASTTRTITVPNSNVDLSDVLNAILKDGSRAFTANQPMGGFKLTGLAAGSGAGDSVRYEQAILASGANAFAANQSFGGFKATNLADPSSAQDAVTLAYLNARLMGLKPKQSVRAASAASTNINLASMPSSVGGVSLSSGDRFLAWQQTSAPENGIYVFNGAGSAATRATDFDSVSPIDEINGSWVPVQEGDHAGKVFTQYGTVATVDTDNINFETFNPIASLIGGDMITFSGSVFSVDLATTSGLESTNPGNNAGQLRIKLEASNPSLQIDGSNQLGAKLDAAGAITSGTGGLKVGVDNSTIEINSNALQIKDAGVVLAKLASNSVDENKIVSTAFNSNGAITGGGGSKIAVQVDGSTIEINSNALRVKDAGITADKLASGVADQDTITGGAGSALAVDHAPKLAGDETAGETFAADVSFAVRMAMDSLTETANRVRKADYDASSADKFWVIGIAKSVAGVSAGSAIRVTKLGIHTLGANDTPFNSADVGKPVWLTASGAFSITAPSSANQAAVKIGIVRSTTTIEVAPQVMGIN